MTEYTYAPYQSPFKIICSNCGHAQPITVTWQKCSNCQRSIVTSSTTAIKAPQVWKYGTVSIRTGAETMNETTNQ